MFSFNAVYIQLLKETHKTRVAVTESYISMSMFVKLRSCEGFGFLSLTISTQLELCWYPVKLCVYDIWGPLSIPRFN